MRISYSVLKTMTAPGMKTHQNYIGKPSAVWNNMSITDISYLGE